MAFGDLPDRIGRYEIVLQIARGGMATVYLARAEGHGGFDRYVALKLTGEHLRDDPEFAQHLVEEAKLVAHLRHTNVVPVLDVGEDDFGAVFLVMEYVPGDSLAGLLRSAQKSKRGVPPRVGLRILVDALSGLHAAHEHADEDGNSHNIIHRDFSPQNILVGTDGIARLTDFGIAKASSRASITMAGTMKGKVSYASPEQARGQTLDRRCDVWAAGVIAWELIAGRKLFPLGERTLLDIVKGPPPRIRSVVPEISQQLDDVIASALELDVDARVSTAQLFGRALASAARSARMFAEIEEVAEHVQHAAQPILSERKEKIAEARMLREIRSKPEMVVRGEIAAADGMDEGNDAKTAKLPPPIDKTQPLPSLPDFPSPVHRMESAPTVPSNVADPFAQHRFAQHRDMMAAADRPSYFTPSTQSRTPSGVSTTNGQGGGAAANLLTTLVKLKATSVAQAKHFIAKRPTLVMGGAAVLLVVLSLTTFLIIVLSSGGSTDAKASAAASASAASAAAANNNSITNNDRSAPPATNAPARPSLGEPEALPTQLVVTANAPITRVRLGKRMVETEVAAPNVAIELAPEEAAGSLSLSATSTDGRLANATWNPGDSDIALTFAGDPPAVAPSVVAPVKKPLKPHPPKHK